LEVIGGAQFRYAVSSLPGYDVKEMGKLILEN